MEAIQMCNYKDYTEKDFDMSSSTNLYSEEETDAAIMLSNAVTGGLTLSQIPLLLYRRCHAVTPPSHHNVTA